MKIYHSILILVAFVFFSLLIQKASSFFIVDRNNYESPYNINVEFRSTILPRINYDGRNYIDIIESGYFTKGIYNLRAFYPFFPLLIYIISFGTQLNIIYLGLLVIALSALISIYMIYKMYGLKTVLVLLTFPSSIFLISYYTESLYLMLSVLFFYFINKKRYLYASIMSLFATATRPVGLALLPVLAFDLYVNKSKKWYTLLIAPLGFLLYVLYTHIDTGNGLQIFSSQIEWGRKFGLLAPLVAIIDSFNNVIVGVQSQFDNIYVYPMIVIEFVTFLFVALLLFLSWKKIEFKYWIYVATYLFLVLNTGMLSGFPRYSLLLFPLFGYVADYFKKGVFTIYIIVSLILNIFMTALFLRGYWIG